MPQSVLDIILRTKKEGQGASQLTAELKEVKSGLAGAIENMTGLSLGSLTLAGGIAGVGAALKGAIDFGVEYNEQVRDLSRLSGASIEETSRLIQTADDLKVEYSTLQAAAKALAKDGIALTTEELAKSSDEYLAITDAGQRAEYAQKKFGKSYEEITKILEVGGDKLREMAAAQNGNLILSAQQVEQAREYEIVQDELNDTMDGFKVAVETGVIPVITNLVKGFTEMINHADDVKRTFEDAMKGAAGQADSYEIWIEKLKAAGYEMDNFGNLVVKDGEYMGRATYKQVAAAKDLKTSFLILKDIEADYKDGARDYVAAEEQKARSTEALAAEQKKYLAELKAAAQDLAFVMGGTVTSENKKFADELKKLTDTAEYLQARFDQITSMHLKSPDGFVSFLNKSDKETEKLVEQWKKLNPALKDLSTKEVEDLINEYGGLRMAMGTTETKIAELKAAHDQAMYGIMFNLMQAKFAQEEMIDPTLAPRHQAILEEMAKSWGLVGQAEVDAKLKAEEYATFLDTHANLSINAIVTLWNQLQSKSITITVTEKHRYEYENVDKYRDPPQKGPGRASGGPVQADKVYLVGERGPELFVPRESGQIIPNDKLADPAGAVAAFNFYGPVSIRNDQDLEALAARITQIQRNHRMM